MSSLTQFAGGGVKSVQSGVFGAAGSASITSVNTTKAVIHCVSKGSAGTVAATGTVAAHNLNGSLVNYTYSTYGRGIRSESSGWSIQDIWLGNSSSSGFPGLEATAASISGGTTNLTVKQYSAVITNATTVTADGPCEWQVVEYY